MNQILFPCLEKMPDFLSSEHLIELGIYSSVDAAYQARTSGNGPQYIKLHRKILYPKHALIHFLQSKIKS